MNQGTRIKELRIWTIVLNLVVVGLVCFWCCCIHCSNTFNWWDTNELKFIISIYLGCLFIQTLLLFGYTRIIALSAGILISVFNVISVLYWMYVIYQLGFGFVQYVVFILIFIAHTVMTLKNMNSQTKKC